jgi:hypothetical protein
VQGVAGKMVRPWRVAQLGAAVLATVGLTAVVAWLLLRVPLAVPPPSRLQDLYAVGLLPELNLARQRATPGGWDRSFSCHMVQVATDPPLWVLPKHCVAGVARRNGCGSECRAVTAPEVQLRCVLYGQPALPNAPGAMANHDVAVCRSNSSPLYGGAIALIGDGVPGNESTATLAAFVGRDARHRERSKLDPGGDGLFSTGVKVDTDARCGADSCFLYRVDPWSPYVLFPGDSGAPLLSPRPPEDTLPGPWRKPPTLLGIHRGQLDDSWVAVDLSRSTPPRLWLEQCMATHKLAAGLCRGSARP